MAKRLEQRMGRKRKSECTQNVGLKAFNFKNCTTDLECMQDISYSNKRLKIHVQQ